MEGLALKKLEVFELLYAGAVQNIFLAHAAIASSDTLSFSSDILKSIIGISEFIEQHTKADLLFRLAHEGPDQPLLRGPMTFHDGPSFADLNSMEPSAKSIVDTY